MVRITTFLSLSALLLVSSAQDDATKKPLDGLSRSGHSGVSRRDLASNVFSKRCTGSCEECFGAGYTLCPGSSLYCYLPGDSEYGIDSCTSDGSSYTSTASAPASTSTGSAGNSDFCSGAGATCVSCFGAGYIQCSDGVSCYNPNDPNYDTCTGGSTGSGGSSSSSCADQYGSGSVPCGSDSCYNPGEGDICCTDGYHCEGGYTCSSTVGKCCAPGSTSSACSGSGSGSGGLSTFSSSTYSSYSTYSFATSTDDGSTSATATGASSSSTGVAQFGASGASSTFAGVQITGAVLGFFGIGMLLL